MPFKANNNREAVVVCAIHVVKRPSKRSVLVYTIKTRLKYICVYIITNHCECAESTLHIYCVTLHMRTLGTM